MSNRLSVEATSAGSSGPSCVRQSVTWIEVIMLVVVPTIACAARLGRDAARLSQVQEPLLGSTTKGCGADAASKEASATTPVGATGAFGVQTGMGASFR